MSEPRRKKLDLSDEAKADVRRIDQVNAMHILKALDRFSATGRGDIKRLKNVDPPEHRLRVGDYRVRFHDLGHTIAVLSVRHRKGAYRD